jgi:hypothetical protein
MSAARNVTAWDRDIFDRTFANADQFKWKVCPSPTAGRPTYRGWELVVDPKDSKESGASAKWTSLTGNEETPWARPATGINSITATSAALHGRIGRTAGRSSAARGKKPVSA